MKSNSYTLEITPIPAVIEILALYIIDYINEYPN